MCLIAFAWRRHADYPLVVAANRDEFFDRPALPARWWRHGTQELFAGRDLKAGGTWLGVGANGRFAALTNVRDPAALRSDAPSRGTLVPDFIAGGASVDEALDELAGTAERYNGFNLLLYDGRQLGLFESPAARGRVLAPGVHALSNADLEADWPKQQRAATGLGSVLDALPSSEETFRLMHDDRPAPDEALPATGVPRDWERALSSLFIRAPGYGTRCTTMLLFEPDGGARFEERSWNAFGQETGAVTTRIGGGAR
ncbi:MAG: NRDE family protein [Rhodocyclaceae bacterium]|nr:NRDE family protein [Rhodocyclaceae bacterium]